jgi:hypothetical protein
MSQPEPSFLESLRVASPCRADWDDMVGDLRVRFCGLCGKNVYDLRYMSRDEAEALLLREGEACVRMTRRADGTVLTGDCPVGASLARRRTAAAAALGAGLIAASALLYKVRSQPPPPELELVLPPPQAVTPVPSAVPRGTDPDGHRVTVGRLQIRRPLQEHVHVRPVWPPQLDVPPREATSLTAEGVPLPSGSFDR